MVGIGLSSGFERDRGRLNLRLKSSLLRARITPARENRWFKIHVTTFPIEYSSSMHTIDGMDTMAYELVLYAYFCTNTTLEY